MSICRALDAAFNKVPHKGNKKLVPVFKRHRWDAHGNCQRCEAKRKPKVVADMNRRARRKLGVSL